ncbi:MAG: cytochrome d ubiquinol oxidase subunit II [bacterium]
MSTLWFFLVAFMIMMYVILDGFDLGAGIAHLYVARSDEERTMVLRTIGPVWDGNEVWLIAGGGSLFMAFPLLYASSFSGFYLPLIIVLWLLILRALSIEFRNHLDNSVWKPFWDTTFAVSSLLLTLLYGAVLGNIVRGVPLDAQGYFFSPLWTTFGIGSARMGILDWYTVTVGLTAMVALTMHGALWVRYKTPDPVSERAARLVSWSWTPLLVLVVVLTVMTFRVQPHVPARLSAHPMGYLFPLLAVAGLAGTRWFTSREREREAFLASALFLGGMLLSVAFGLYPYVLPAINDPLNSLTVQNASAPVYGLKVALAWWIPGMILATGYTVFMYRKFAGKVSAEGEGY